MLYFFENNRDIYEVDKICNKLESLKRRITIGDYSDSRKEFNECKELFGLIKCNALANNNEELANAQIVFKNYFMVFCNLAGFFKLLQEKQYKQSWNILQDCIDDIKFVGKFVDVNRRKELPEIYDLLLCYEKLYPYNAFVSSEYIISKSHCSICEKSMQGISCTHIKGNLYHGEVAREIIDEIKEFQAACLVSHPEDKRCIIELADDKRSESEKFMKLDQFLNLRLPFLQQFKITTKAENRQKKNIIQVGRNEPCSCGSGKKFKKCCGKDMYYKHERNLISPGQKIKLEY